MNLLNHSKYPDFIHNTNIYIKTFPIISQDTERFKLTVESIRIDSLKW